MTEFYWNYDKSKWWLLKGYDWYYEIIDIKITKLWQSQSYGI